MRSPPLTWRRLHLLAVSMAPLLAAGCEKQPVVAPASGPPAALAPQPQARREKAADVLLRSRVTTRLWDDPGVPAGFIAVSVKEGHVTLEGRVGTVVQVERARLAALAATEVAGVTSKLLIGPDDGSGPTQGAPGPPPK